MEHREGSLGWGQQGDAPEMSGHWVGGTGEQHQFLDLLVPQLDLLLQLGRNRGLRLPEVILLVLGPQPEGLRAHSRPYLSGVPGLEPWLGQPHAKVHLTLSYLSAPRSPQRCHSSGRTEWSSVRPSFSCLESPQCPGCPGTWVSQDGSEWSWMWL